MSKYAKDVEWTAERLEKLDRRAVETIRVNAVRLNKHDVVLLCDQDLAARPKNNSNKSNIRQAGPGSKARDILEGIVSSACRLLNVDPKDYWIKTGGDKKTGKVRVDLYVSVQNVVARSRSKKATELGLVRRTFRIRQGTETEPLRLLIGEWSAETREIDILEGKAMSEANMQSAQYVDFWNEILGPKFIKYKHILVDGQTHHSEAIFPSLPVKEGDKVLDIGCVALAIPQSNWHGRTGQSGSVVRLDCCEASLEYGRKDAAKLGVRNVSFV
jgi:hypothetical protein